MSLVTLFVENTNKILSLIKTENQVKFRILTLNLQNTKAFKVGKSIMYRMINFRLRLKPSEEILTIMGTSPSMSLNLLAPKTANSCLTKPIPTKKLRLFLLHQRQCQLNHQTVSLLLGLFAVKFVKLYFDILFSIDRLQF